MKPELNRMGSLARKIAVINSLAERNALISQINETPASSVCVISFLNAHAVNMALENEAFFNALMGSDLLLRDGVGVKIMMKIFGLSPGLNMNGTDLIPETLCNMDKKRLAVFGTEEPWLGNAVSKLSQHHEVVGVHHGFEKDDFYCQCIQEVHPEVVLLAMGMPKQELVAQAFKKSGLSLVVINGGAVVDFIGGKVSRAPALFRFLGMEWVYRLALEPGRLWKRYLVGNVKFLFHCLVYRCCDSMSE